jgi:hypothetical protein
VSRGGNDIAHEYYLVAISAYSFHVGVISPLSRLTLLIVYRKIGWKFYLALIIPGTIGGVVMFCFFPDTKGLPLEEIAALFGDEDDIAVYQREIDVKDGGIIEDHHADAKGGALGIEDTEEKAS